MLEGSRLVEILHAIEYARHHAATLSLIEELLSDSVPKLLQSLLFVSSNHLLVASSQVQSDLSALEPVLHSSLALHVGNVLLESLLLDPESL